MAEGDTLVVDSPRDGLVTVSVEHVADETDIDLEAPFSYKWAVCKVDTSWYDLKLEKERECLELIKRAERRKLKHDALDDLYAATGVAANDILTLVNGLAAPAPTPPVGAGQPKPTPQPMPPSPPSQALGRAKRPFDPYSCPERPSQKAPPAADDEWDG